MSSNQTKKFSQSKFRLFIYFGNGHSKYIAHIVQHIIQVSHPSSAHVYTAMAVSHNNAAFVYLNTIYHLINQFIQTLCLIQTCMALKHYKIATEFLQSVNVSGIIFNEIKGEF